MRPHMSPQAHGGGACSLVRMCREMRGSPRAHATLCQCPHLEAWASDEGPRAPLLSTVHSKYRGFDL